MTRLRASTPLLLLTVGYGVSLVFLRRAVGFSFTSPWFVLTAMICLLGWLATARPVFLPRLPSWLRQIREWEVTASPYRMLGVDAFGALLRRTPLRLLNLDVYLRRQRHDPISLMAQLEAAEAAHLWDAVLVAPYVFYAALMGWWKVVFWFTVAQLAVNVYPILHLRHARGRLARIAARLSGRLSLLWFVAFLAGPVVTASSAFAAPVHLVAQAPVRVTIAAPGVTLVDFGRAAFGNLKLMPPSGASGTVALHFGEALEGGRVNRHPPGTVRYAAVQVTLAGDTPIVAAPPADARNTKQPAAILTPPGWGVVLPFRWVEIEGWPGELLPGHLQRQAAFASSWDDSASAFTSSDERLDRIWELCRYSIKATTFAGIYVDGDRERIPYEADAYLNQLSHYATDRDVRMARDTFDRLMSYPTWPTEWAFHMIFMAHADWMHTGDAQWLAPRFDALRSKLLLERARADGLLVSSEAQRTREDIVDWPAGERDGYVFTPINTVVNAFHVRALALMAELATALGRATDAEDCRARERRARASFQRVFFDPSRGLYRDGEGAEHVSLHANLFPLAFGLVPSEHAPRVTAWLAERGMACSVYAAQYFLEGLFEHAADSQALALIAAETDRSWRHMVESGTTMTWEAWDQRYKPNQDWNHAWGAAPANLLPRFVLGARALEPGWRRALIQPHPGGLTHAEGTVPTPRGAVEIRWTSGSVFRLTLTLPAGVRAHVELPAPQGSVGVFQDRRRVPADRAGAYWRLSDDVSGAVTLEVR